MSAPQMSSLQMATAFEAAMNGRRFTCAEIQRAVCAHYEMGMQDLLSVCRSREIVRPRQVGMYLARGLTPKSYPEIGRRFGNRDHTTVIHAVNKIDSLCERDGEIRGDVEDLIAKLVTA